MNKDLENPYANVVGGQTPPSNTLTGKHFLHVSYPSGEYYYAVPNDWKLEDIKLIDVTLYYKGEKSSITAFDYIPDGQTQTLVIDDDQEALTRICHEYRT